MNQYSVYILYSRTIDRFYIGFSSDVENRIAYHNSKNNQIWTKKGTPWTLFLTIELLSQSQAMKIEQHIKSMKSRKYIQNLAKYPEMQQKLILKYKG